MKKIIAALIAGAFAFLRLVRLPPPTLARNPQKMARKTKLKKKKPSLLLRKKKLISNSSLQSKMPALRGHFFGLYFADADTALIMEPMVNFRVIFFRQFIPLLKKIYY